jgi:hypothetical protein
MDRKTFQQGMAYLAAAYDTALSKQRLAVYWDQLRGLRDRPFMTAVKAAVGHGNRGLNPIPLGETFAMEKHMSAASGGSGAIELPGKAMIGRRMTSSFAPIYCVGYCFKKYPAVRLNVSAISVRSSDTKAHSAKTVSEQKLVKLMMDDERFIVPGGAGAENAPHSDFP